MKKMTIFLLYKIFIQKISDFIQKIFIYENVLNKNNINF